MVSITEEQAFTCCASKRFAQKLASSSPYAGLSDLIGTARRVWWRECGVTEWLAALSAHPRIGDNKAVESKPAAFAEFSRSEQAAAASTASADVASELSHWNQAYAEKFGFIFIICAKGKSSSEVLSALKARFNRLPHEELQAAAAEQMKITEMRLAQVVGLTADQQDGLARMQRRADQVLSHVAAAHGAGSPARSPITTHVLDTATGYPAHGLPLALLKQDTNSMQWETVAEGVTNEDGRVGALLPPNNYLEPGRYRMHFNTAVYLAACRQRHPAYYHEVPFYPEVAIDFEITPDRATEHYHIPLLLSPYGYSTYRGS